jgi:tRNA-dihydrouridine synthase
MIWKNLNRPIHVLAPMEDVTDSVFRRIVNSLAPADLYFTEFIKAERVLQDLSGLLQESKILDVRRLVYFPEEKPIIAQIWGNDPESYRKASIRIAELGYDGIDINMGCPVKKIVKKGYCSALIQTPDLAAELIEAAGESGLPVSVKTRIGFSRIVTEDWIGKILRMKPAAITIHGRIAAMESEGPVHWDEIAKIPSMRDELSPDTLILGNGSVESVSQGNQLCMQYGLDGIMYGRAVFENLYLFSHEGVQFKMLPEVKKVQILKNHLESYHDLWGDRGNYEKMKKFYKIYTVDFPEALNLRAQLMETHDYLHALNVVNSYLDSIRSRKS